MNIFIYKISKDDRKGEITMDKNAIDVLVIDDDGTISHSLESYLATREDIEHVDCAGSVREAMEYCNVHPYDVAIVDLVMPGHDGFSFLEKLHNEHMPKIPDTIVVSAISSEDVIKKAFDMGAKYYMVKPYQNDVLYRRIWDVLSLRGATQTAGIVIKGKVSLEQRVADLFLKIGVPPHLKGYQYLKEAVKMTVEDRMIIYSITKRLHPEIAEHFHVTATKVELAIRHTIEVMYDRDKMKNVSAVLGFPVGGSKQKPTNGEFIALLADKLISDDEA